MNHHGASLLGEGVMMPAVRGSFESLLKGKDVTSTQSAPVFHRVDTVTKTNHHGAFLLGEGVMMPAVRGSFESLLKGRDVISTQSAPVFHGVDNVTKMNHRRTSLLGDGVMMPAVRGSFESLLAERDVVSSQSAPVFHGVDTQQTVQKIQAPGKLVWERPEQTDVTQYKTKALAAHRRWIRKNQVEDTGSSAPRKGQSGSCSGSGAANVVLYVGFGMIGVGMIMTFVGLGERGFQTDELKLIGPSLISAGVFFCVLRVCFCTVGASCANRLRRRRAQSGRELISADQLRAVRSGQRPVTHHSGGTRSLLSGAQRPPPPAVAPPQHWDEETSTVPVLPPIRVSGHSGAAPPVEVLLDPQTLDRPPSAGSVMSPLTPVRRRPDTPETGDTRERGDTPETPDCDIDEFLR